MKQVIRDLALAHQSLRAEDAANKFDHIQQQQSQEIEQLRQLVQDQGNQKANDEQQKNLRQLIFLVRQAATSSLSLANTVGKYFLLLFIERQSARLTFEMIDSLADKQWHADTVKMLTEGLTAIRTSWGEEGTATLVELSELLQKLYDTSQEIRTLQDVVRNVSQCPTNQQVAQHQEMFRTVNDLVEKAETISAKVPATIDVQSVPNFDALKAARTEVIDARRTQVFLFKCLVLVAKADGHIEPSEAKLLTEQSAWLWLAPHEAEQLIADTRSVSKSEYCGNHEQALADVDVLVTCARVDGRIAKRELTMIRKIGVAIGVKEEEISELVQEDPPVYLAKKCDPEAFVSAIAAGVTGKLKELVLFRDQITDEIINQLKLTLTTEIDGKPLVIFQFKVMNKIGHAVVLTQQAMYLHTRAAKLTQVVPLEDIAGFKAGVFHAKLRLHNGSEIKTSIFISEFLNIAVPILISSVEESDIQSWCP
ncbi:MAG: hypothetical protein WC058_00850 [Phycisphaeraceae bacterium]